MSEQIDAILSKNKKRNEEYIKFVERYSPLQNTARSLLKAFVIGGVICCFGQFFSHMTMLIFPEISKDLAGVIGSVVLIFVTVVLTGFGVFDRIAYHGGGGTFLPITGFANSIASAAIEFKSEGIIFGLSAKFFSIAGPVIIGGIMSSFAVGFVYWIIGLFM